MAGQPEKFVGLLFFAGKRFFKRKYLFKGK